MGELGKMLKLDDCYDMSWLAVCSHIHNSQLFRQSSTWGGKLTESFVDN